MFLFNSECHDIKMIQDIDGNWRVAVYERIEFSGGNDIISLEKPEDISDVLLQKRGLDVLKFKKGY
jgi:hypothetical protein